MHFIDFLIHYGDLGACMKYYPLLHDPHTRALLRDHIYKKFDLKIITTFPYHVDIRVPGTMSLQLTVDKDHVNIDGITILQTPSQHLHTLEHIQQVRKRVPQYYYVTHGKELGRITRGMNTTVTYRGQRIPVCMSKITVLDKGVFTYINLGSPYPSSTSHNS